MQNSRDEFLLNANIVMGQQTHLEIVPNINENVMQNGITLFFSFGKRVVDKNHCPGL